MPIMNGDTVVKNIKKTSTDIPILVHTIDYDYSIKEKCIKAGCNEVIHKPLHKLELLLLIEKWIDRKVGNYDLTFVN
jgi:CheY-like chemotaxis protein